MATFFMFGKYSAEALKGISAERTAKVVEAVKQAGGEVKSMHALLGDRDLVFVVDLPGTEDAVKVSIAMNKLTDIAFSTVPAISVDEFDKLVG
jgi:uncharacterized protein with GYD domain